MATALTIFVATLPVVLLLAYFWHRDRGQKEPYQLMKRVFLWGMIITLPVAIVEGLIYGGISELFGLSLVEAEWPLALAIVAPFLFIALPEEAAKLWVVHRKAYRHKAFNEIMDGITYCILASMGFAILENVIYTLQYGVEVGILRAFTAVPAHALFSGIMGYYIGLAKFQPKQKKRFFRRGLLAAIFFHGLYDFLLLSGIPILAFMVFPLLAYMWTILHHAIRLANAGMKRELKFF